MESIINKENLDLEEKIEDVQEDELDLEEEEELEEDEDNLSLAHYLELCLNFEDDPTEENSFELTSFLSKLQIRDFLPLQQKTIIAVNITRDLINELDATGAASTLETGKVFKGMLGYVVNLKNDIGILDKTFVAYDYCYMYGLVDTILEVCSKDYQRLCSYIDNMINVSNAYRLIQTASILNDTEYNKWINTLSDLKEKITPEMLQSLLAVDSMNNGGDDIKKILGEFAVQETNKTLAEDEAKYNKIAEDLNNKFGNLVVDEEEK